MANSAQTTRDPRERYDEWNAAIVEEVFPRGRAGTRVYLAVHDGLLADCGARIGRGGRSDFVQTVKRIAHDPGDLFVFLERMTDVWKVRGRTGPPPFVAGLALAVLAAGDMDTDGQVTRANYYARLWALLGGDRGQKAPPRFEATVELWQLLRTWLRDERRGELVLRGIAGPRQYVDPVKSQCLVRSCDLDQLREVYAAAAATADGEVEPDDLAPVLDAWLSGPGSRSRLAALIWRPPDHDALQHAAEALCDAIEAEVARNAKAGSATTADEAEAPADVPPRDASRAPLATLAIRPSPYPSLKWKRAEWCVRVPVGGVDDVDDDATAVVQIDAREVDARFDVREPPAFDATVSLAEGAALCLRRARVTRDDDLEITPKMRMPAWFQDGASRGRPGTWDMVTAPSAGETYVVVAPTIAALHALAHAMVAGPDEYIDNRTDLWPGPGLAAAVGVQLRPGATLPGGVIVRSKHSALRLRGGLLVRRGVYLEGGLPALVLGDAEQVVIERLDADLPGATMPAVEFPRSGLTEGRYRIMCGAARTEITVIVPRWDECRAPTESIIDATVHASLLAARVRGAIVTVSRRWHIIHLRPGQHCQLLAGRMHTIRPAVDRGLTEGAFPEPIIAAIRSFGVPLKPDPRAACFEAGAELGEADRTDRGLADTVLDYISSRGEGSLELVRSECRALIASDKRWHSILTTLEDLGHADISWTRQRWSVAPAVASPLATDPSRCYIAGVRARDTVASLQALGVPAERDPRAAAPGRQAMPALIIAPADALAAHAAHLQVLPTCAARELAPQLKTVMDDQWWTGAEFMPSSRVQQSLEMWDPQELRWRSTGAGGVRTDLRALYRWFEGGRRHHLVVLRRHAKAVADPSAAKWLLAPRGWSFAIYDRARSRLVVPRALGLPRSFRRAAVLASGLMPMNEGRALAYDGVPLALARMLAVRLNQNKSEGLW